MKKSFQRVIATLNLFQGKQSLTIFLLAAIFALTACDDSSSASSNEPDENAAAESSSSSVCKDCEDGDGSSSSKKVESSDNQSKDSSSDAKSNSSSSKKENTKNSSSSQKGESSSSEFVFKLCEDGDTSSNVIAGKIYYNSCKNGQWNLDSIGNYVDVKPKVYPNMDSVFGSEFKAYGTYEDLRDNNVYKTTKYYEKFQQNGGTVIDSFTVMAQNLNYAEIMIDSTTTVFDDSKVEKRCYKDDPWYCDNYFGARYTWSEAMGLPKVCDSVGVADNPKCNIDLSKKVQGVCPTGWHVMTETEWKHFAYTNGLNMGYSLLSHAVWEKKVGNNPYGMSVLPDGDEDPYNKGASFWIPYEKSETSGGLVYFGLVESFSDFSIDKSMKFGFHYVRCVLDDGDTFLK